MRTCIKDKKTLEDTFFLEDELIDYVLEKGKAGMILAFLEYWPYKVITTKRLKQLLDREDIRIHSPTYFSEDCKKRVSFWVKLANMSKSYHMGFEEFRNIEKHVPSMGKKGAWDKIIWKLKNYGVVKGIIEADLLDPSPTRLFI